MPHGLVTLVSATAMLMLSGRALMLAQRKDETTALGRAGLSPESWRRRHMIAFAVALGAGIMLFAFGALQITGTN